MAYIILTVSFLLVAVPAWFSYIEKKNERNRNEELIKRTLLTFGFIGGMLSFYSGCDSYQKSQESEKLARQKDSIAKRNDSLYKDLLHKNLNAVYKSLDTVNVLFDTSRSIIKNQNHFLKLQNSSFVKLNEQLDSTSNVLRYSRQTLKYVIGDTSIPIMNIGVSIDGNNKEQKVMMISYSNKSETPIFDLKVVLPNFQNKSFDENSYNVLGNTETQIGTLTKNYIPTVFSKKYPSNEQVFGLTPIGTVWRNGYYISFVYFKKDENGEIKIEAHHYNGKGEFSMPK